MNGEVENEENHEKFVEGSPQQATPAGSPESQAAGSLSPSSTPIRMRSFNDVYASYNVSVTEPYNVEETMKDKAWKNAMLEEINVIEKKNTSELGDTHSDKDIIGVKE